MVQSTIIWSRSRGGLLIRGVMRSSNVVIQWRYIVVPILFLGTYLWYDVSLSSSLAGFWRVERAGGRAKDRAGTVLYAAGGPLWRPDYRVYRFTESNDVIADAPDRGTAVRVSIGYYQEIQRGSSRIVLKTGRGDPEKYTAHVRGWQMTLLDEEGTSASLRRIRNPWDIRNQIRRVHAIQDELAHNKAIEGTAR